MEVTDTNDMSSFAKRSTLNRNEAIKTPPMAQLANRTHNSMMYANQNADAVSQDIDMLIKAKIDRAQTQHKQRMKRRPAFQKGITGAGRNSLSNTTPTSYENNNSIGIVDPKINLEESFN